MGVPVRASAQDADEDGVMAASKKPTGLTIARNGNKYTFTWKLGEQSYAGGQALQWHTTPGKWQTITIGNAATTKSVTLTAADWYPATTKKLQSITFRVRGKKTAADSWSDWADKTYTLAAPRVPSLTAELTSSNVTRFSWSVNTETTDARPFSGVEWQSMLVRASNTSNGAELSWRSSALGWATSTSASASSYSTRTEDSTTLTQDSYTRWFRIRSRGMRGVSDWRYSRHVYATPYKPKVNSAKATKSGQTTTVTANWTAPSNQAHPIDSVDCEYLIATPAAGMAAPSGQTWSTGATIKDTGGDDGATFVIDDQVGADECLWVRVVAYHDARTAVSNAYLVRVGALSTPSGLSVTTNDQTAVVTATNNSDVPDSVLAIVYKDEEHAPFVLGVITDSSATVTFPASSGAVAFGVYAFQGSYSYTTADGVNRYTIKANAISPTIWNGGAVPLAPTTVTVEQTDTEGEVLVSWSCDWTAANMAELSWSTNPNAWQSTKQPDTFEVSNLYASNWRVSELTTGEVYYFKVRLGKETGEEITWSPYSAAVMVDLSSAPSAPVLETSAAVIPEDGSVSASWTYVSTDGTAQVAAEICEATVNGSAVTYGNTLATVTTAQSVTISAAEAGWTTGGSYAIAVRVTSGSGHLSAWSDPVPVTIADPVTIAITQSSLTTLTLDDGDESTRTVTALTDLPLTVTVSGAGAGGTTMLVIERAASYVMDRPDESLFNGYEGEAVYIFSQTGETQITVEQTDLIGMLDDGAQYRLIATVSDTYGQSAETSVDFEVHWTDQAVVPEGTATVSGTYAIVTPVTPAGYSEGGVCDVYRLSADKPVKILEGAEFGTAYVDPYPTIGDKGGYRFVYVTANGDYITEDGTLAWIDVDAGLDTDETLIDFGGDQVALALDMDVSHSWTKDFAETTYLGGSIQGDWNLSVHRSTSVNSDTVVTDDPDLIDSLRRLATYAGVCHVRTVDGSTFAADVQVNESRSYGQAGKVAAFGLTITQVSPEGLDGMLLSEWNG